jgi:HD-GYP domain-containing protein (c-di-GMP phosphodiesterase class II)
MLDQFMQMMGELDPDLSNHGSRVAALAAPLADYLGVCRDDSRRLHIAAHLHDVGKIRVDRSLVMKPGPLTTAEWVQMRTHPLEGFRIIDGLVDAGIADTVVAHHERFDGSGYPFGLQKDAIPYLARILLVADAYDAMTSDRPYQPALSSDHALGELQRYAGTQFDPDVVDAMLASAPSKHRLALAG